MVWAGIHFAGKTDLVSLRQTLTAQRYCGQILRPVVLTFMAQHYGFVFQQDNPRPHIARHSTDLLQQSNILILPWPSRSHYLATIKHICDILDRRVRTHHLGMQASDQLKNALEREWTAILQ